MWLLLLCVQCFAINFDIFILTLLHQQDRSVLSDGPHGRASYLSRTVKEKKCPVMLPGQKRNLSMNITGSSVWGPVQMAQGELSTILLIVEALPYGLILIISLIGWGCICIIWNPVCYVLFTIYSYYCLCHNDKMIVFLDVEVWSVGPFLRTKGGTVVEKKENWVMIMHVNRFGNTPCCPSCALTLSLSLIKDQCLMHPL